MRDLPPLPDEVEELDGTGLCAVPGLVDCHTHLAFAAWHRQFLDGAALLVPAQKVHAFVRACGIALQHPFNQADRLDVLPPIQRCAQTEAGHGVRHRDLGDALALVLAANALFGCRVS